MARPALQAIIDATEAQRAAKAAAPAEREAQARAWIKLYREPRRIARLSSEEYSMKPHLWPVYGDPTGPVPAGLRRFLNGGN